MFADICPVLVHGLVVHSMIDVVFIDRVNEIIVDVAWHSPAIKVMHIVA